MDKKFITSVGAIDPKYLRRYDRREIEKLLSDRNDLLEVCKEAETAILDAMHAGNLSRSYANCVIGKIEQAIAKANKET